MRTLLLLVVCALAVLMTRAMTFAEAPAADDKQALTALEDTYVSVMHDKNADALKAMLDDDFVLTRPNGEVTSKTDFIDAIVSGQYVVQSGSNSEVKVRLLNDNAALVTGTLTIKASAGGNDLSGDYRYTDVLVKRDGKWVKVATQYSKTRE